MAVLAPAFDETQRATLAALCETYVPSVEVDSGDPLEREFMARSATDLGVAAQIEAMLSDALLPEELALVAGLLDELATQDFANLPVEARTQVIHGFRDAAPEAKLGLDRLKGLTFLFFYALPDEQGSNPNWEAIGYPGPTSPPPDAAAAPKTITLEEVTGESATVSADVCVVGSGAGGSVIAAKLAAAGKKVLVLEMGGYRNEQDFKQLELPGYLELYYGAGLAASEDGSVGILAGQTLGGGTVVNYMNCIPTPERIVAEWSEHGLVGLDDDEAYRREHIGAVLEDQCQHRGDDAERDAQAPDGRPRRDGTRAPPDRAQRGAQRRPAELWPLRNGLPARLQALGDEDLAPGRIGQRRQRAGRRARRADPDRGRASDRRRGDGHPRRWLDHRGDG
jgi:hypothetical protein